MDDRSRLKQGWTIAKIELRRAFFSKRAFWVYGLALFPCIIFLGHTIVIKIQKERLSSHGLIKPAVMDNIRLGESADDIVARLGAPPVDYPQWRNKPTESQGKYKGITTHTIQPPVEARYIKLSVMSFGRRQDPRTRIYEFEAYGPNNSVNLALKRPATGSRPCSAEEGPEKAFNGSVSGGRTDSWCTSERQGFLSVDLGNLQKIDKVIVKHASAGGEKAELDAAWFSVEASRDNTNFFQIVQGTGARFANAVIMHRYISYFDGTREANLDFTDGKLVSRNIHPLLDFEEDRRIFAGIFQYFYLRLAIFFGCLGIFMNLFRGEMLDRTLHFWFLVPARREVLLAGKYAAGLIASTTIFVGGALLCFAIILQKHNAAEVSAYWQSAGLAHVFWYAVAAALGCIGYGSVFLATGLLLRNPIIPAAILLVWESINSFLPDVLQKLSVLYYLQSLCPTPAPRDETMPALLRMLLAPAAPASRTWSIIGLLVLTALVLWVARYAVRRMQISYGADA
jgi:ABC-type transport system involved in multi-copper enzyme maturation permease subunit